MTLTEQEHGALLRLTGPTVRVSPYLPPVSDVTTTNRRKEKARMRKARRNWKQLPDKDRRSYRRSFIAWVRGKGWNGEWTDMSDPASEDAGRPAYIGRRFVGWKI